MLLKHERKIKTATFILLARPCYLDPSNPTLIIKVKLVGYRGTRYICLTFAKDPQRLILLLKKYVAIVLINTEIPKVTYYYIFILDLNLKCIRNILKAISIAKDYFI